MARKPYTPDFDVVWADRPPVTSFDAHLKEMVEIHEAMFKALLGLDQREPARQLAAHFEEIAKRYLAISVHLAKLAPANDGPS